MNSKIKGHWFLIQWIPDSFTHEKFNVGVGIKYQEKDGTLKSYIKTVRNIDKLSEWYNSTLDDNYEFIMEIIKAEFSRIGLKETKKEQNIEYLHMGITALEYYETMCNKAFEYKNSYESKLSELAKQYLLIERAGTKKKSKNSNEIDKNQLISALIPKLNIQCNYFITENDEEIKSKHTDIAICDSKYNKENILELISSIDININIKSGGYSHGKINELFAKYLIDDAEDIKNNELSSLLLKMITNARK